MWEKQTGLDRYEDSKPNEQGQVELVVVAAGHQIFGLLMSQIVNIVRTGPSGLQVLKLPDPPTRAWGEINYQDSRVRVLELSRQLSLPLVEPIERSRILLSSPSPKTRPYEQFGVAVDDILMLRRFNLSDFRLVPRWLCSGLVRSLVWGALLVESESIVNREAISPLPTPFQPLEEKGGLAIESLPPESVAPRTNLSLAERLTQKERKTLQVVVDKRRPLILLDLQPLNALVFPPET